MGTRFLSAEECTIHPTYQERILKANDLCTMVTGKRLGHPVRSLRTNFARNYSKAEYGGMDDEALEALGSGDTLQRHDSAGAGFLGDAGLLGGGDVHDDAALQHLGQFLVQLITIIHSV